jgi:hypothetical protein
MQPEDEKKCDALSTDQRIQISQYGHKRRPESAFLGSAANDFGIVRVLDLAVRPYLAGRSLFTKRPDSFNLRLRCSQF